MPNSSRNSPTTCEHASMADHVSTSPPRPRVNLDSITFSDGTTIPMPRSGVVVIVGPNNSGKSQALRDIRDLLGNNSELSNKVVSSIASHTEGTIEELTAFVRRAGRVHISGSQEQVQGRMGHSFGLQDMSSWWGGTGRGPLGQLFTLHASTENRLEASRPQSGVSFYSGQAQHPLHYLKLNPDLEAQMAATSGAAFGSEVFLDTWSGGTEWSLRVGTRPGMPTGIPTSEQLNEIRRLPILADQGDGVRSFLGLLLEWLTGSHSVALVDEPEAFLHPPQAKLIGKTLARDVESKDSLLLVSTHSKDVLLGLLDASKDATVIRLTRDGNVNHAAVLDSESIGRLWRDPILRHSNLLDGLFSQGVVLCEGDADCTYYSAVADSEQERESATATAQNRDVHFAHCGGKTRLHTAAAALRAVKVPVAIIPDFDILRDWNDLRILADACGFELGHLKPKWNQLDAALSSRLQPPLASSVHDAVTSAITANAGASLTESTANAIREAIKLPRRWDEAKAHGKNGVPAGDARSACEEILEFLANNRIYVVPGGELESWQPTVPNHGPKWLADVLEAKLHENASTNVDTAKFLEKVFAPLSSGPA